MTPLAEIFTEGARDGQLSFEQVYEDFFAFVYRNARRLGVPASAADDVVQEVFVVLYRKLPTYDGRATLQSWVYGILAYTVRDYRRAFRRKQGPLVAVEGEEQLQPAPSTSSPERRAEHVQDVALLMRLLQELPDAQRELIVLADLEQLSIPEICECVGGNSNTVYSRLRVAREALKAKLARHLLASRRPNT
ncbi:MAG: polymerase sigma factor RpoE [Polyangiaceae bacterium]|jgi:RNA polymerase sigma-70 factor (ECF subfamily)|nr:polymerase sigma factor RpoE [Polyangiaceae bacterium]